MRKKNCKQQFDQQEIREASKQLVYLLRRNFHRQGNQGAALGIFPVVGHSDGSLDDSYRLAEPGDPIDTYHDPLNALQPEDGPFYVHTHANQYDRRGVLLPDISGFSQPGSNLAIYERERLIVLTTELLLRVAFQLGHKPGLVLPSAQNRVQVFQPNSDETLLLKRLHDIQAQVTQNNFVTCLKKVERLSPNLEFAVVVSDFMSSGWEKKILNISRRSELVVFQIIDPWDLRLPNLGQQRIIQDGQQIIIDTGRVSVRRDYAEKATKQQRHINAVMRRARARCYKLSTTKPLLEQFRQIFRLRKAVRQAA